MKTIFFYKDALFYVMLLFISPNFDRSSFSICLKVYEKSLDVSSFFEVKTIFILPLIRKNNQYIFKLAPLIIESD